jgi:hypothetical protein
MERGYFQYSGCGRRSRRGAHARPGVTRLAPAPTPIATQLYSQATMTKMIARCTQQGQSIEQAIAWASDEIEGFMRG